MNNDLYATLGVPRDASQDDIKRAWRKCAHTLHPDREGGNEQTFTEASAAYEVLSDPARRRCYDETGDCGTPSMTEHLELLAHLFDRIIDSGATGSILAEASRFLNELLATLRSQLANNKRHSTRLTDMVGRVSSTGDIDLYDQVLQRRLISLRQAKVQYELQMVSVEAALVTLAEYSEKIEPQPQQTFGFRDPAGFTIRYV